MTVLVGHHPNFGQMPRKVPQCLRPGCLALATHRVQRGGRVVAAVCFADRDALKANGWAVPDSWKTTEQLKAELQASAQLYLSAKESFEERLEAYEARVPPKPEEPTDNE